MLHGVISWFHSRLAFGEAQARQIPRCDDEFSLLAFGKPTEKQFAARESASRVPANRRLAVQIRQNLASPRCDRWLDYCGRGDPEGDGVRNHRGIARAGRVIHRPDPDGDLCGDR